MLVFNVHSDRMPSTFDRRFTTAIVLCITTKQARIQGGWNPTRGLREGGPAGTLFRSPTTTEGAETEGTFECLLLRNSELHNEINPDDKTGLA